MGKKNTKGTNSGYLSPVRLSFPDDERVHDWLSPLLDAYCIVDRGVSEAIKKAARKHRKLACSRGCSSCCRTHHTIPVYPLELVGISWYATEKISAPERETLKNHLRSYNEYEPCPFLLNGVCIVHPMRPVACRQFIVFDKPCAENEDPYYTRPKDILAPIKGHVDQAFFIMLPFYGVTDEFERRKIIQSGAVHKVVKLIQTCNWKSLADKMDDFDKNRQR
jgi:Fe-S-cluster containining protein